MDLLIITILMIISSFFGGYLVYFVFDDLIRTNDLIKFFVCLVFTFFIFMSFILIISFIKGLLKNRKNKKNESV